MSDNELLDFDCNKTVAEGSSHYVSPGHEPVTQKNFKYLLVMVTNLSKSTRRRPKEPDKCRQGLAPKCRKGLPLDESVEVSSEHEPSDDDFDLADNFHGSDVDKGSNAPDEVNTVIFRYRYFHAVK